MEPKFRSFKAFHVSPASDVRKFGGLVLHEIFTKKFRNGIVVDLKEDENCLMRENLQ
jgi:hypothetical protein